MVQEINEFIDTISSMMQMVIDRKGEINDYCELILEKSKEPPDGQAYCYKCNTNTHWRGPVPHIDTPPSYTDERGRVFAMMPYEGEQRADAAKRMYKVINEEYRNKPMKSAVPGLLLWQGALCWACEARHIDEWMTRHFPKVGTQPKRLGTEID